jgi:hypothetical protein
MNIFSVWSEALFIGVQSVGVGLVEFLPKLVLAVIMFAIGYAFAGIASRAIVALSVKSKFEDLFSHVGVTTSLQEKGVHFSIGKIIGEIIRWFIVIIFLIPALEIIGLSEATSLLKISALTYLPKVILAVLVMVVSLVLAEGAKKAVTISSKSANIGAANTLGGVTKYAIVIFGALIALTEMGIASELIYILVIGVIGMFAVGGAIAIGLGGKDLANDILSKAREELRSKK